MLHEQIKAKLKEAMKNKDAVRLQTIRGLLSAFVSELTATKRTPQDMLSDDEVLTVIKRTAKQRKDAIQQFTDAGRDDLAAEDQAQLAILEEFLPEMMSQEEIKKIAEAKKAELGVDDKSQMGMLIGAVMKETAGQADGSDVKDVVQSLFA